MFASTTTALDAVYSMQRFFGDLESFPLNNLYANVVCNKEMKYVQWAISAIFLW
jgi:hypothetical protein